MKVITAPRRGGKTTAAVKWMAENPKAVLIVAQEPMVNILIKEYPQLKGRVFPPNKDRLRGLDCDVAVDNADLLLYQLLGVYPKLITLTGVSENLTPNPWVDF